MKNKLMNPKLTNKSVYLIILFSLISLLFLTLLSYKIVLFLTPFTDSQQKTIDFLYDHLNDDNQLDLQYASDEYSHLLDVKRIMNIANVIFYLSLLAFTSIITLTKRDPDLQRKMFKTAGITTISVLLLLVILSLFAFNGLFNSFHQIFFPQGNWIFANDSLLITTFPTSFFIKMARNIFILSLTSGIFLFSLSLLKKNVR
ncbi:MAG: DUF1461 domain-containing protein [archaeon]|nr:DUF1461 domain-containing protein [archaeon]